MPSINLRLTEEQHRELEAWAHDGHRSLQKEIIWRLFTVEGNQASKVGPATNKPRIRVEAPADGTMIELPAERLSEGENATGGPPAQRTAQTPENTVSSVSPGDSPSESRPSPGACGMSNRHHMNSKLHPCPRCGYPA